MNKLLLAALLTWALGLSGANCGAAKVPSSQTPEPKASTEPATQTPTVTLTPAQPSGSFPVDASILKNDPEILEVAVTKVVNPSRTAVNISVYLADSGSDRMRTLIGSFSLHPADRPGTFLLNPAAAVEKLCGKKPAEDVTGQLEFELKRNDGAVAGAPVEVTIAAPKWPR